MAGRITLSPAAEALLRAQSASSSVEPRGEVAIKVPPPARPRRGCLACRAARSSRGPHLPNCPAAAATQGKGSMPLFFLRSGPSRSEQTWCSEQAWFAPPKETPEVAVVAER